MTRRTIYLLTSPNLLNAALNDDKNQNPLSLRISCFQQLLLVILSVQDSPESFMETRVFILNPLIFLVIFLAHVVASSAQLSFGFYAASCPSAEFIVRNTVRSASSSDPTIPGKLLRLLFHDCFVEVSLLLFIAHFRKRQIFVILKLVQGMYFMPPCIKWTASHNLSQ